MLEEEKKVPDFHLDGINEDGKEVSINLHSLLRKNKEIILYFYPKDNTPGCTTEACDFRDNLKSNHSKFIVIGISKDNIASHKKFMEKHGLNFMLLSGPEHILRLLSSLQ